MKSLRFVNKQALKEFQALPENVARDFMLSLRAMAQGDLPFQEVESLTQSVGKGALELKINGRPAYRTVYVAKFNNDIWVLSAFTKTTNGVDRKAMATAKRRYKIMQDELQKAKKEKR